MSLQEFEQSKKPKHYLKEIFETILEEDIHEVVNININEFPLIFQGKLTKNLPGEKKNKIYFQIVDKKSSKVLNYGVIAFSDLEDREFNKLINIFEMELEKYKPSNKLYLNPKNIEVNQSNAK